MSTEEGVDREGEGDFGTAGGTCLSSCMGFRSPGKQMIARYQWALKQSSLCHGVRIQSYGTTSWSVVVKYIFKNQIPVTVTRLLKFVIDSLYIL